MCPCVWPLPWQGLACGPRSVAPRPDFLIGRALVFALWNSDRFSRARFLSSGVSRGLLACCSSLRTAPRATSMATSKVTHYYSSSHSFPREHHTYTYPENCNLGGVS
jgi:hypothetical protein